VADRKGKAPGRRANLVAELETRGGVAAEAAKSAVPAYGRLDYTLLLVTVLAYTLLLWFVFRLPPRASDQMIYFLAAESPFDVVATHHTTRLGVVAPTWIAQEFFGFSEGAYYAVPFLSAAVLVIAVFVLSREVFAEVRWGRLLAVLASFAVGLTPLLVANATHLLPDLGSVAFFTLGMALLLRSRASTENGRAILLAGAAACFGASYLFRETVVLLAPVVALVALASGVKWRHLRHVWPLGAILAIEALWGVAAWGDPLARVRSVLHRSATEPSAQRLLEYAETIDRQQDPILALSTLPRILVDQSGLAVALVLLIGTLACVAFSLVGRNLRLRALSLWIVGIWVGLLVVGAIEPSSGRPVMRTHLGRYWYPIIPPMVVGTLYVVQLGGQWVSRRFHGKGASMPSILSSSVAVGLLIVSLSWSIHSPNEFTGLSGDRFAELRTWLARSGDSESMAVDGRSVDIVRMYTRSTFGSVVWGGRLKAMPVVGGDPTEDVRADILVLNKPAIQRTVRASASEASPWAVALPASWRIWELSTDDRLVAFKKGDGDEWTGWEISEFVVKGLTDELPDTWRPVQGRIGLGEGDIAMVQLTNRSERLRVWEGVQLVEVETEIDLDGPASYRVVCAFSNGSDETLTSNAISVDGSGFVEGTARTLCEVPAVSNGALTFVPRLRLDGPGSVDLLRIRARTGIEG
jgi:hypothetical protein